MSVEAISPAIQKPYSVHFEQGLAGARSREVWLRGDWPQLLKSTALKANRFEKSVKETSIRPA